MNFVKIFTDNGVCVSGQIMEVKNDEIVVKYICPFSKKEFLINSQIYDIGNIGLDYIVKKMNIDRVNVYVLKDLYAYADKNKLGEELYSKLEDNMAYIEMRDILKYVGNKNDIKHTTYIECFYPYRNN